MLGTIVYYNEMANQHVGLEAAQDFSRLYPVPNMDHCSGGATTDQFDILTPLTQWVENGTPQGPISATGVNFTAATYQVGFVSGPPDNAPTTRSRPLCPYPQEALYRQHDGSERCTGGAQSGGSRQRFELCMHHTVAPLFAISRSQSVNLCSTPITFHPIETHSPLTSGSGLSASANRSARSIAGTRDKPRLHRLPDRGIRGWAAPENPVASHDGGGEQAVAASKRYICWVAWG